MGFATFRPLSENSLHATGSADIEARMNAPTDRSYDPPEPISLETIELELALQSQATVQAGFEGAVSRALEKAGGALLFHMRVDDGEATRWTAAVSIGAGQERQFLIVTIPAEGNVRIEPLDQSDEPLARIAPAFADVMERLGRAA